MNCPKCGTENQADAKFCKECGSSFTIECANCSTRLPFDAKFCHECGTKVESAGTAAAGAASPSSGAHRYMPEALRSKLEDATAGGAMVGERRTVTMLFCDVQGSTAAAEQLDPEEWTEIMNGALERLIEPVYRYEGTLARIMGDAILAFFGAPIAHEDDPERAVLAALDILAATESYAAEAKARHGVDFAVRVGINTGLVVVGEVGSDLHLEYTAMGDAVNLAARMEQTADPGTIQLTSDTYRLVAPLFDFEDLGSIEVKGKSEPVSAYRVVGRKAERGALRGIEGLRSPLVGRESELGTLRRVIEELMQGRGQLASIVADAGLGKSRLVAELRQNLIDEGLIVTGGEERAPLGWVEGRSLSYDVSTPYAPFIELFSRCFGFEPADTPAERYGKVAATCREVVPDSPETTLPYLANLLGLELSAEDAELVRYMEPPQLRERVFDATARLVEGMAKRRPLVLVFDDVHWIDANSIDLLESLLDVSDRAPVLLLALFRPLREDHSWRFHERASRDFYHRYSHIPLRPLDQAESGDLVRNLLHVEGLADSTRELILSKAEGNPFFVEEVIRSLLDAGVVVRDGDGFRTTEEIEDISVPDTLSAVLTTRLDRLPEEARLVAQTAAVIGREFTLDTLERVHDTDGAPGRHIGELVRRELVREKGGAGNRSYVFKHALTQETAYASVLLRRRRKIHLAVGDFLETSAPERVQDIARHFAEAGADARAFPYLVSAGQSSFAAYSVQDAISFFRRALDARDETSDGIAVKHAYEGLAGALLFGNDVDGAIEVLDDMLAEGTTRGHVPMQVSALNKKGLTLALRIGEVQEGEELLARAKHLAEAAGDHPGLAEYHQTLCYVSTSGGRLEQAKEHQLESQRIGIEGESAYDRAFGLAHFADTLLYLADFEAALPAIEEARRVSEELGEKQFLGLETGHALALYTALHGDPEAGLKMAREGLGLTSTIGAAVEQATCAWTAGHIAALVGRYEEAIDHYRLAVEVGMTAGLPYIIANSASGLAGLYDRLGGYDEEQVRSNVALAEEMVVTSLGRATACQTWLNLALWALGRNDLADALRYTEKGRESVSAVTNLTRPWLLALDAILANATGDPERAGSLADEADAYTRDRGMRLAEPFVVFSRAGIAAARGELDTAADLFAEAVSGARDTGQLPLLVEVHLAWADTLEGAGRTDEVGTQRRAAARAVEDIAATFASGAARASYLSATDPS